VNGQGCDGVTNGAGLATCTIVPSTSGLFTLAATYAGDGSRLAATSQTPFSVVGALRGDADGNAVREIGDVFYLINGLFAGGPDPATLCRGDVNADDVVDIQDVFFLINYLYAGGPAPGAGVP